MRALLNAHVKINLIAAMQNLFVLNNLISQMKLNCSKNVTMPKFELAVVRVPHRLRLWLIFKFSIAAYPGNRL